VRERSNKLTVSLQDRILQNQVGGASHHESWKSRAQLLVSLKEETTATRVRSRSEGRVASDALMKGGTERGQDLHHKEANYFSGGITRARLGNRLAGSGVPCGLLGNSLQAWAFIIPPIKGGSPSMDKTSGGFKENLDSRDKCSVS